MGSYEGSNLLCTQGGSGQWYRSVHCHTAGGQCNSISILLHGHLILGVILSAWQVEASFVRRRVTN